MLLGANTPLCLLRLGCIVVVAAVAEGVRGLGWYVWGLRCCCGVRRQLRSMSLHVLDVVVGVCAVVLSVGSGALSSAYAAVLSVVSGA